MITVLSQHLILTFCTYRIFVLRRYAFYGSIDVTKESIIAVAASAHYEDMKVMMEHFLHALKEVHTLP